MYKYIDAHHAHVGGREEVRQEAWVPDTGPRNLNHGLDCANAARNLRENISEDLAQVYAPLHTQRMMHIQ